MENKEELKKEIGKLMQFCKNNQEAWDRLNRIVILINQDKEQTEQKFIDAIEELKIERNIGDIVSHKADKNSKEMWIKIVGKMLDKSKTLMYKCTYIDKDYVHRRLGWRKKFFWNSGDWLRNTEEKELLKPIGEK